MAIFIMYFSNKMNIFSVFILSMYLFVYLNYIAYEKFTLICTFMFLFLALDWLKSLLTSCLAISWI